MTLTEVTELYKKRIDDQNIKLLTLQKKIFRTGTIRLVVVVACIGLCYALWGTTPAIIFILIVSIVLFLFLLKYHNKLFDQRKYCELLIQNAENELKGIDYDFSAFDGAPEKANALHSYSTDLDLFGNHSFFQSINRTATMYGKNALANSLLYPFQNKTDIEAQQEAIEELSRNPKLLDHFRAMGKMNEAEDLDIASFSKQFLQTEMFSTTFWRYLSYAAPFFFLFILFLYIFNIVPLSVVVFLWTLLLIISLIPLKKMKQKVSLYEKKMDSLHTYSKLFEIIEQQVFSSVLLQQMQDDVKGQRSASSAIDELKKYSDNFDQSFTALGFIILNPCFFWNVIYGIKVEKWVLRYKDHINNWFHVLGKFDSLVSFALYAYNHPDYTYPKVSDTLMLKGTDLGHPLLNRNVCVRNDISINQSPFFLVVTGANMAGKSTYLRTVGINLMLACSGAPVCATAVEFYPYSLVTNLRTSDSLTDNESYFFAELKRLKMIIDRLQTGEKLFIILDEILKGTNSEDKQKGSLALMKQLVSLNGNGIIATHDLLLGCLEKEYPEAIKNYRFEADIKDDQLSFTYKIREGVAQNMNASFLMRKMGITGL